MASRPEQRSWTAAFRISQGSAVLSKPQKLVTKGGRVILKLLLRRLGEFVG